MKFEKKVVKYLDFESEDTKEKGYQYITYHLSSNLLFSQTSSFLSAIMRLPWTIHLKCVNPNRGGGGGGEGNDSRDDRTIE